MLSLLQVSKVHTGLSHYFGYGLLGVKNLIPPILPPPLHCPTHKQIRDVTRLKSKRGAVSNIKELLFTTSKNFNSGAAPLFSEIPKTVSIIIPPLAKILVTTPLYLPKIVTIAVIRYR